MLEKGQKNITWSSDCFESLDPLTFSNRVEDFFLSLFLERSDSRGGFSLSSKDTVLLEELNSASSSVSLVSSSLSPSSIVWLTRLFLVLLPHSSFSHLTRAHSNYARNIPVNFIFPIILKLC